MSAWLNMSHVQAGYGPVQVLFDVNLTLEAGEVLALLGDSISSSIVRCRFGGVTKASTDSALTSSPGSTAHPAQLQALVSVPVRVQSSVGLHAPSASYPPPSPPLPLPLFLQAAPAAPTPLLPIGALSLPSLRLIPFVHLSSAGTCKALHCWPSTLHPSPCLCRTACTARTSRASALSWAAALSDGKTAAVSTVVGALLIAVGALLIAVAGLANAAAAAEFAVAAPEATSTPQTRSPEATSTPQTRSRSDLMLTV